MEDKLIWQPYTPRRISKTKPEIISKIKEIAEKKNLSVQGDANPRLTVSISKSVLENYHPSSIEFIFEGENHVSVKYQIISPTIWIIRIIVVAMTIALISFSLKLILGGLVLIAVLIAFELRFKEEEKVLMEVVQDFLDS